MPSRTISCRSVPSIRSAVVPYLARSRFLEAGYGSERGGFAGAVRSDKCDHLTLFNAHRNTPKCFRLSVMHVHILKLKQHYFLSFPR